MEIICASVLGAAIALKAGRKIDETLAPATMLITLTIYIPGLFAGLLPGFFIALALAVIAAVYCVYMFIKAYEVRYEDN